MLPKSLSQQYRKISANENLTLNNDTLNDDINLKSLHKDTHKKYPKGKVDHSFDRFVLIEHDRNGSMICQIFS